MGTAQRNFDLDGEKKVIKLTEDKWTTSKGSRLHGV